MFSSAGVLECSCAANHRFLFLIKEILAHIYKVKH